MYFARCDDCCNVLEGIDDVEVFECSEEVKDRYGFEHMCEDCIASDDEIYLFEDGIVKLVQIV